MKTAFTYTLEIMNEKKGFDSEPVVWPKNLQLGAYIRLLQSNLGTIRCSQHFTLTFDIAQPKL